MVGIRWESNPRLIQHLQAFWTRHIAIDRCQSVFRLNFRLLKRKLSLGHNWVASQIRAHALVARRFIPVALSGTHWFLHGCNSATIDCR